MSREDRTEIPAGPRRGVVAGVLIALVVFASSGRRAALAQATVAGPGPFERVIVLGFDGADPELLDRFMAEGELPSFRALRQQGSFLRLATSTPAQSPVSWSSILTGLNPGRTGIFGFVQLSPVDGSLQYTLTRWSTHALPSTGDRLYMSLGAGLILGLLLWAVVRMVGFRTRVGVAAGLVGGGLLAGSAALFLFTAVPASIPATAPVRDGTPFYKMLADQGLAAVALQAPMDTPPPAAPGLRVLCGLGVPDIAGQDASWAIYTSEILPARRTPTGGRIVLLESLDGINEVDILGPSDPFVSEELAGLERREANDFDEHERLRAELERLRARQFASVRMLVRWKPGEDRVTLELPEVQPVTLRQGEWSDFLPVTFRSGKLVVRRGLARFYVARAGSELRLYQEPIGWDPRHPNPQVPLSSPPDFVSELARRDRVGLFETTGWACATNALKDEMIDERAFVEDVADGMRRREAILREELERKDWRCLFAVFTGVDRIQHMLWRHLDDGHPAHRASEAGAGLEALREMYRSMDRLIGMVMRYYVDDRTALILLSDHGFASFRWSVHLNAWLRREGYLAVRPEVRTPATFERPFPAIDWTRTRAFAYGLGQIRINVKREGDGGRGIVPPGERAALVEEIAGRLLALEHEGRRIVHAADRRDAAYSGPHLESAPDLIPGFVRGYRVSAATILGEVPPMIFEPNESRWSGDHCSVAPELVPGILLTSFKLPEGPARVIDVAPTVLALLGARASAELDGRALEFRR
jgi:predicted AlkP superfamily phosphohydrolase/phosphomutase